jgi:hypothetical protein
VSSAVCLGVRALRDLGGGRLGFVVVGVVVGVVVDVGDAALVADVAVTISAAPATDSVTNRPNFDRIGATLPPAADSVERDPRPMMHPSVDPARNWSRCGATTASAEVGERCLGGRQVGLGR